jgi:hypothetical protein
MVSGITKFLKNWGSAFLYPRPLMGIRYLPRFLKDWRVYSRMTAAEKPRFKDSHPYLADSVRYTPFDPHYFYQAAWLARRLPGFKPERHIDVGSSVMTIGVLSATVSTIFVDWRPLLTGMSNLWSIAADITCLPFKTNGVESLSCLHVIEHIGLGRYGDRIDPEGSGKAARELQRVLKEQGRLYLSLPVGRERVCFNAHRVFRPQTVLAMFKALSLVEFSFVGDGGAFVEDQPVTAAAECEYGCGLFIFEKRST